MESSTINGRASIVSTPNRSAEIVERPKRRRFSIAEKRRIVAAADACAPGTLGGLLRREGIYSSLLANWRKQRDHGKFDPGAVRQRSSQKAAGQVLQRRNAELEKENRKLNRRLQRAELILDIQKSIGALGDGTQGPRCQRDRLIDVSIKLSESLPERTVCLALGVSRSTLRRRQRGPIAPQLRQARHIPRQLNQAEQDAVLALLYSDRFADIAVPQVVAQLLDEGRYLCSESTMYRLLRANGQVQERRRLARHPEYVKPELVATGPRQVLSWDITKVRGPQKGIWYSLLVMIDIFSRFVVGWTLVRRSNAKVAEHFVSEIVEREGLEPGQVRIHNDRGTEMTAETFCAHLDALGVARSLSRPQVSNDNPYSEAALVSGARELHPRALSEPYVKLSLHTAPAIQQVPLRKSDMQRVSA